MKNTLFVLTIFCFLIACSNNNSEEQASENSKPSNTKTKIQFTEISKEAGIDMKHESGAYGEFFMPETMGSGAAFIDYNQDNYQDIIVVGGGSWEKSANQNVKSLRLYKNKGDGTFQETTAEMGLDKVKCYGFGVTVGDYDNDGDDDFYVTTLEKNLLFRNDGTTFTEVGKSAGVDGKAVWSTASIFIDVDKDGFLDLFVGNYIKWSQKIDRNIFCSLDGVNDNYCHPNLYEGEQGVFYYNNGDGTFSDETKKRGFTGVGDIAPMKTLGLASIDFDKNGHPDLVFANDMQPDLLFQNKGDGTFQEMGTMAGIAYNRKGKPRAGMGIAIGDLDNSGNESIVVGNFSRQPISVYQALPNGMFKDNAYSSKIGETSFLTLTFGVSFFDADLDGDQDIFTANGHVFTDIEKKAANIKYKQPPHFFVNNGKGTFSDNAAQIGGLMQTPMVARGSATADIDNDGDIDLLITENNGNVHLLRNDSKSSNHFLRLALKATTGNPNAIDAKVTITYNGKTQTRRVKSSDSYLSQSEFPITFGLGEATKIDKIEVIWLSGEKSVFENVEVDKFYELSESINELKHIGT